MRERREDTMNTRMMGYRVSTFCWSRVCYTKGEAIRCARRASRTHNSVIVTNEATRARVEA
jgi:hypothetical protein